MLLPVTVTSTIWPFGHVLPIADVDGRGRPRELVESFVGVESHDDEARARRPSAGGVVELPQRHDALAAARQVDEHVLAMNLGDAAGDARLGGQLRRRCTAPSSDCIKLSNDRSPSAARYSASSSGESWSRIFGGG